MALTGKWRKSSRSGGGGGGECVEARVHDGTVQVRDSKNPDGPVLTFLPGEWEAFLVGVDRKEFNLT